MHIPDGFLNAKTCVATSVVSGAGIFYCLRKTARLMEDKTIPLMGVMAAFVFAAQMINFPVLGGTSGHLLGGVLASVLLGPSAGAVIMACVLIVQCFVFQDGGVTALGANILNMALVGSCGGYFLYRILPLAGGERKSIIIRAGIAACLSVVLSSLACSFELAASHVCPLKVVLPAMVFTHALIGIGEAMITFLTLSLILKVRPDLLFQEKTSND